MTTTIKLLNNDVALERINTQQAKSQLIHIEEDMDEVVKFYRVLAISDNVTDVKVGDKVVAPWPRLTNEVQVPVNGVETKVHITDIYEILGVVEDE